MQFTSSTRQQLKLALQAKDWFSRRDRIRAALITLSYVCMGIFDVVAVFIVGIIGSLTISGVSTSTPGNRISWFLQLLNLHDESLQRQVASLGMIATLIFVSKSLFSMYLSQRILLFMARKSAQISRSLITKVFQEDLILVRTKTSQETIHAVTEGVNSIVMGVFGAALLLVSDVVLLIIFGATFFFVDTTVALTSLIFFICLGYLLFKVMHLRATKLVLDATEKSIANNQQIQEILSCYREIYVRNRRSFYTQQIGDRQFSIAESRAKLVMMSLISKYLMEIGIVLGGLLVGAIQFLTQPAGRAIAVISIFLVSSTRIMPGILRIQTGLIGIKTALAIANPTFELVKRKLNDSRYLFEKSGHPEATGMSAEFIGSIDLEKVTYRYAGRRKDTIRELSLQISPGEFVGIAGPSGAGKSTLVDLMLGVLNVQKGRIQISGLTPSQAVMTWPGAIGYVPQDINFVSGTIKENICIGFNAREVPDEDISTILKAVQLEEILQLPLGIDTPVGENGYNFSGGQRQRLGLARALFTNPSLLILDEATSSLDSQTESLITEYLRSLRGNLTLVVIAHRISTIVDADKIYYLRNGSVKDAGTFNELCKRNPEFDSKAKTTRANRS
jgi:ABC-type multidrug transport system fused ATPase/permease subunit